MNFANTEYLRTLAVSLKDAERMGQDSDGPEGNRYIQISDTLADKMASKLLEIVKEEGKS